MRAFAHLRELADHVGQPIGVGEWMTIDQSRVDRFAEVTDDLQWIHTDPVRAAEGPFGATIAHGFLTLSLLPSLCASAFRVDGTVMGVNYGLNRVRFPAPVPVGSRVRAHCKLLSYSSLDNGAQVTIEATVERERSAKPVCVAELVSRRYWSE
ncbi:MaoC family dehydratase [Paraburkholderia dinghuensis]|uniref:MaoC family dehydratase n=1 Tax=Paraburkholderia dinghuensis TaxID=2305225 RepID=A0A3N6P5C6_9BURK|nr:MaoC family dehydratase [Paraburkholderia dinghuensis]RQH08973.1 MaoC family dehydratase [Paraburkholderia dinghuensis]